jgi:hypothetical protein
MRGMRTWTKFALLGPYPSFGTLLERVGPDSQFPVNLLYIRTGPTRYISPTRLSAGRPDFVTVHGWPQSDVPGKAPGQLYDSPPSTTGGSFITRQQGTEQRGVSKAPNLVHVLLPRVLTSDTVGRVALNCVDNYFRSTVQKV